MKKRSVSLQLPFKPFSTNKLYFGRKVRSTAYKNFRDEVLQFLSDNYDSNVSLDGNLVMSLEAGFSSPLADLSNCVKSIEDIVAEYFGFNDKKIVSIKMDKYLVNKGSEYMVLKINKTKKDIDRRVK